MSATALAKTAVDRAGSSHGACMLGPLTTTYDLVRGTARVTGRCDLYDFGDYRNSSVLGRSRGLGETLRQAGDVLRLALDEVKFWTKRTVRIERFEKALKEADLEQMKFWHGKLGSPDLAQGHFDVFERFDTAMDVFVAQWVLGPTAWRDASSEAKHVDVREHIAWLQGHGARFSQPERSGCEYHCLWLGFLIGQGLNLTGVSLGEVESDMPGHCFLGPAMFIGDYKVPARMIRKFFLRTGAGMWPLDLPGASADAPPPGFSFPSAEDPDDPDNCYDEVEYNQLSLFWPDQFPRRPDDGVDEWPQVAEIRDSVTGVCRFFAWKREKQRRNEAWKRRRLVVLCTSTLPGEHATKRKKTEELTGLGALVHRMMGGEPQLWRDVVAFL